MEVENLSLVAIGGRAPEARFSGERFSKLYQAILGCDNNSEGFGAWCCHCGGCEISRKVCGSKVWRWTRGSLEAQWKCFGGSYGGAWWTFMVAVAEVHGGCCMAAYRGGLEVRWQGKVTVWYKCLA